MTTPVLAATDLGISGPQFLSVYVLALAVAAGLAHLIRRAVLRANTPKAVGPEALGGYRELSPAQLGYLADGDRRAVLTALGTLVDRGVVDTELHTRRLPAPADDLEPLAGSLAAALREHPEATRTELVTACAPEVTVLRGSLEDRGLLYSGRVARLVRAAALPIVACAALGVVRLALGVASHRPVLYLVLLIALTAVLAWVFARTPTTSPTGERYLAHARNDMAHLGPGYRPAYATYGPLALPAAVALFGLPVLALTWPDLAAHTQVVALGSAAAGGGGDSGGSGGDSCGSSGSSCGGGGCGGGCGG